MAVIDAKLKRNIWKFYLQQSLSGMFFCVPILVLFWQDNGLSLTEVMLLQSIFAILTVSLEIPSGYFADIYGRRITLLIGSLAGFIAIVIYSIGVNFYHFLLAEIFFAIRLSFYSGTTSAFLYDTLLDLKEEKRFKKIWGNALFLGMISLALSNVLGGFIAKIDFRYTLYASIPFFLILIPLTFSMIEPKKHDVIVKRGYALELLKTLKSALLMNRKLRWIIIYSGIIFAFNQSILWGYQPYFKLIGLDIAYFGIVFASFQLVAAFSSKYAYIIEAKLGQKYSLIVLLFLVAGSYLLMGNFVYLFSFSFCFIQQFVRGFKKAVVTDYINQLTTSNVRATVLSVESFIGRLIYALIIPFFGLIADLYSLKQALIILGVTALVSGLIILIILRKDKVI